MYVGYENLTMDYFGESLVVYMRSHFEPSLADEDGLDMGSGSIVEWHRDGHRVSVAWDLYNDRDDDRITRSVRVANLVVKKDPHPACCLKSIAPALHNPVCPKETRGKALGSP